MTAAMDAGAQFVIVLLTFSIFCASSFDYPIRQQFEKFVARHGKVYQPGGSEYEKRYNIFKANLQKYDALNEKFGHHPPVYGINKFSDLTDEEFQAQYLSGLLTSKVPAVKANSSVSSVLGKPLKPGASPPKWDWRSQNIISAVKNQHSCGACWAFCTTETVESMYAMQAKKAVPELSVQEVIDCAKDGNAGCKGGDTCAALEWMRTSPVPIVYESSYPLTDQTETCRLPSATATGVKVQSYTCVDYQNKEQDLVDTIYSVGPVAVTVDASTWNNYMGGIIQYHCENHQNHAVQIVGYDMTGDVPYYIVRNSWGEDFGDKGYLYIKIGGNLCGISQRVSTVSVKT